MSQTQAGIRDPRKTLVALTWNVGSLQNRLEDINTLLITRQPHLLFLQEAKDVAGAVNVLRGSCRYLGYVVVHRRKHNLITVAKRGLAICGLKDAAGFRVQRIAIQLKKARVLIRHVQQQQQ